MPVCQFYQRGGVQREQIVNARPAASHRDTPAKWVVPPALGMRHALILC